MTATVDNTVCDIFPISKFDHVITHDYFRDDAVCHSLQTCIPEIVEAVDTHTREFKYPGHTRMQHDNALNGPILRLFTARAKQGRRDELAQKFATTSVDVVRDQRGNVGYFYGPNVAGDEDRFVFASVWEDLNAVKTRFGEDWQSSYLPPGYADLIEDCSVRHYDLGSGWHLNDVSPNRAG